MVCAPAVGRDAAQVAYARVYTAKIPAAGDMTQAGTEQIARTQGSIEIITFPVGGDPTKASTRTLVRVGERGLGYPGFSVDVQQALAYAGNPGGTTTLSGGAVIQASPPQAPEAPLRVRCTVGGQEVLSILVYLLDTSKPRRIEMVMPAEGTTVVQVYEYLDGPPAAEEMTPVATGPVGVTTASGPVEMETAAGGGGIVREDGVSFDAQLTGLSWNWDSKWWPGNDEDPGAYPLQVRFIVGAGADINSEVDGNFVLDYMGSQLQAGSASGDLEMNFGAQLSARGALKILWFAPYVFNIPYVPQFDMRVYDYETFSSFLLDSSVDVSDATGRQALANINVVDLIGGSWLPDWVKNNLNAGIAIEGALAGSGTMTCNNIALSDGTVFTSEGESKSVTITSEGYHATATYNENLTMTGTLILYPSLYVHLLDLIHWSYPVFELPWNVFSGPVDLSFSTSALDFPPIMVHLTVTKLNPNWGSVSLDPPPADPNDPQYVLGTPVTVTATPISGKAFLHWELYDPNYPDDDNYKQIDPNNPITIVMDSDRHVQAVFKCSSGVGEALPLLGVGLVVCGFVSRRLSRRA